MAEKGGTRFDATLCLTLRCSGAIATAGNVDRNMNVGYLADCWTHCICSGHAVGFPSGEASTGASTSSVHLDSTPE